MMVFKLREILELRRSDMGNWIRCGGSASDCCSWLKRPDGRIYAKMKARFLEGEITLGFSAMEDASGKS